MARDGAATLALGAGVDMKVIQHMLRHSSIKVTMDLCANVAEEVVADAARKLAGARQVEPARMAVPGPC
jgi:site-specific recombinase XerD